MYKVFTVSCMIISIFGCGGGGSSNQADETTSDNNTTTASEIVKELTVNIANEIGQTVNGTRPEPSTDENAPIVKSAPDAILTNKGDIERVDLLFNTEFGLKEVYITVDGADSYIKINNPNTEEIINNSEVISLWFDISQNINIDDFCVEINAKDLQDIVSDSVDVCFSIVGGETDSRVIYFADFSSNSTLSTLDFDTGDVTAIGATGVQLTDIGFLGDQLYGVTFSELVALDRNTGNASVIGSIGNSGTNALVGKDGILFSMSTTGEYFQINPSTGTATNIHNIGSGAASSGDLVFNSDGSILWGTVTLPGYMTDQLIQIDVETNTVTIVGDIGFYSVYGLAYLRNQLLGLTAAGEFIIIDPDTGNGTLVENTDAFSAGGAASE
ncbi:MAG: hypothetical protein P8163_15290 [Candidatus Thiodiazotropha sp.]